MRGSLGFPVAGVGTPARRYVLWQPRHHGCAQARPRVPYRRPRGGPLVACDHLVPKGLCSRHSVHKFTRDPDLKVRLVTFWTLSVPAAARAREHGQGVWCPVMGVASKELLGCWRGDPARGFQVGWHPEGPQRQGRARQRSCRRSRNNKQVHTPRPLPVFGRQLQASGSQLSRSIFCFSGAFSTFQLFMGHMGSSFLEEHGAHKLDLIGGLYVEGWIILAHYTNFSFVLLFLVKCFITYFLMITGRISLNILPFDYYIFPAITLNHFTLKGASRNILKNKKDTQNLGDSHNFNGCIRPA